MIIKGEQPHLGDKSDADYFNFLVQHHATNFWSITDEQQCKAVYDYDPLGLDRNTELHPMII